MTSESKMKIPHTQTTMSSHKQGSKGRGSGEDGVKKTRRSTGRVSMSRIIGYHDVTITAVLIVVVSLGSVTDAAACPSQCSCSVESKVFCNNRRLNTTPTDFTSVVEQLYLFNNNITTISPRTLQPLKNLKILDLSGNRITNYALWDTIFSQLKLLENLILHRNKISRIPSKMFQGLTNLARIYLQDNEISVIEAGAFNYLPNLVELKLRNNRLVSFPRLEHTPNLLLLDLGFNRLTMIRDMALSTVNLEHLKLQSNKLTQLRTSVFDDTSRLTQLDISDNRLTAVPMVVKSLTSLRALNMSINKVGSIPRDTFLGMTRLKVLDLHGMGLKTLPFGIIPPRVILNVLDITENNWDCGCGTSWMPQYITIFEPAFVEPEKIKCSEESKLKGRKIKDLKTEDFECTDEELARTLLPPTESTTTKAKTPVRPTRRPWVADPCDVYPCFNGGTCTVVGNHPKCKCNQDWAGSQCQISLTTPTTTTSRSRVSTTRKISGVKPSQKPELLINKDSITETSVEIILPQTETELVVSVREIGQTQKAKEQTIKPMAHPFTVMGLESGKSYNICIHLPLGGRKDRFPPYIDNTDTLCGSVRTEGIRVVNTPVVPTKIRVVPSPGVKKDEDPTEKGEKDTGDQSKYGPGTGEGYHGDANSDTTSSESTDFKILYPAIGAGIGAIIIIIVVVMFFVCYRQKKMQKLKSQNNQEYIAGAPVDTNPMVDMEMATVVHHHHHNHYNAGGIEPTEPSNAPGKKKTTPSKKNTNKQNNFSNNNSKIPKSTTPIKTSSLGRSSNSSNSNSGTLQSHYVESPHRYPQYMPPTPPNLPQYEAMPTQRNGRGNEFIFRNHQNNNTSVMQMPNNHCIPTGHYADVMDDMQPLVGSVNQYHYRPGEGPMYQDQYGVNPRNEYIPPPAPISYPPANSRSAFQPIQNPRKNTVRTPTSESGPITTHVNTAQVLPTSTCLNRNLMTDNMTRYPEGVPVV